MPSNTGIMRFIPNQEIDQAQAEAERRNQALQGQQQQAIVNLAGHIRKCWQAAYQAKIPYQEQMKTNLRQRNGEYDANTLAKIKEQGGSDVYLNITNVKCRAAEAQLNDIMLPPGERPFQIDPTPKPDLAEQVKTKILEKIATDYQQYVMQGFQLGTLTENDLPKLIEQMQIDAIREFNAQAEKDSQRIEDDIDDELVEGDWYEAVRSCIPDVVTSLAGIICGPYIQNEKKLTWSEDAQGRPFATVSNKSVRKYRRCNPFDIYPSPGSKSLQDGYLIEIIPLSRSTLNKFIGVEGFDDEAIRLVLQDYGRGGLVEWLATSADPERLILERRPEQTGGRNQAETIDCIKFMGPVQGILLRQWGMDEKQIPDPVMDYEVTAYLIGNYVIKAKLNEHPLGRRNYYSASFEKSNDSVWGRGVPQLMVDVQRICNGCARALMTNMSHASGPMVWIYYNRIDPTEQIGIRPWKLWKMRYEPGDSAREPLGFFQPKVITNELLKIYEFFFNQASEITGIPAYTYGSTQGNQQGAQGTASGLSMLMNSASKVMKMVAFHIDNGIIKPSVEEHWLDIMMYEPEKAVGDVEITARASEYLIVLEQLQIRRMEFLGATNNPIDQQIIGIEGRAEILREAARSLKMRTDKIVPDREDMQQRMQQSKMQTAFMNLAQTLNVPVDVIAAAAQGQLPGGAGQNGGGGSKATGPDGQPVAGQDFTLQ